MEALIFGSIDSVCDTSELQLEAFNQAFDETGLDWFWSRQTFARLQRIFGTQRRLCWYAENVMRYTLDWDVADRIRWQQNRILESLVQDGFSKVRPGVLRLMDEADSAGVKLGLVCVSGQCDLQGVEAAVGSPFALQRFDVVVNRTGLFGRTPGSRVYEAALRSMACEPAATVAIEDTETCMRAADDAGVACVGTPNEFSVDQDFSRALACVSHLGDPGKSARQFSGTLILDHGMVTLERLASCVSECA